MSNHAENNLHGQPTQKYVPELGRGVIVDTGGLVCSHKLPLESDADFYLAGEYDHLAKMEDGTFAVIDDKTTSVGQEKFTAERQLNTYRNQVNGYAYALEHPASKAWLEKIWDSSKKVHPNKGTKVPRVGERDPNFNKKENPHRYSNKKIKVTRLGLNNFRFPHGRLNDDGNLAINSIRLWAEVKKDYGSLLEQCQTIADIVMQDTPPPPPNIGTKFRKEIDCTFCYDYIKHSKHR